MSKKMPSLFQMTCKGLPTATLIKIDEDCSSFEAHLSHLRLIESNSNLHSAHPADRADSDNSYWSTNIVANCPGLTYCKLSGIKLLHIEQAIDDNEC